MLFFESLSDDQIHIVKQICFVQLNSLRRIYNNKHHSEQEIINILIDHEISEDRFREVIEEKLNNFKALHKNPNDLSKLNDIELSRFRHILAQIEDHYKSNYPQAIANLWNRLFIIEEFRTIENLN